MTEKKQISSCNSQIYSPRIVPFLILGFLLLLGSIAIVIYWIANKPIKRSRTQQPQQTLVHTTTITQSSNNVIIKAKGFISPKYSMYIRSPLTGIVDYISPKLITGEHVTKGEVLLHIEDTDYKAALAQAQQNLADANNHYLQEKGRSRQAKRDNKRLGLQANELNLRKPQLTAVKTALENAEIQLELAKKNITRTTITAPFNGVILDTTTSIGELITPASNIAHIAGTDTYTLKLRIPQSDKSFLSIGDKVSVTDAKNNIKISANINRFDAGFNKKTRSIGTYIDIDKPISSGTPLLLESYVSARITGSEFSQTAWVDNGSIVDDTFVWKRNDNDTISPTQITVIYSGSKQSLISFNTRINNIITHPQSGFYTNQKVTTNNKITGTTAEKPYSEQAHEK